MGSSLSSLVFLDQQSQQEVSDGVYLWLCLTCSIPDNLSDSLLPAFSTGQERRNKPESSAAKLYCLHLQEQEARARARALLLTSLGARAQESKSKSKSAKGQERERKRTRTRKQEKEQESKREKKNGETLSLLRRIILRLGRITP